MYLETYAVLKRRVEDLVLGLAERYGLPYSVVRERCAVEIRELRRCLETCVDPLLDCRLEAAVLRECVEELGEGDV